MFEDTFDTTPAFQAASKFDLATAGETSAILNAIVILTVLPNSLHLAALPLNMKSPDKPPPSNKAIPASKSAKALV